MTENEIAKIVVDAAYCVHKHFGPGLFETVYEVSLVHELRKRGLAVERQKVIAITYDSITFDEGFRADVIVEDKVILELLTFALRMNPKDDAKPPFSGLPLVGLGSLAVQDPIKAVEEIHRVHKKQLLTYLRLTNKRLGLLINFNEELIKHGIFRVVNGLPDDE